MGARRDQVDLACESWARVMRELLGLAAPRQYLGGLRCTLAARRDLHHGARTQRPDQRWPEFPFAGRPEAQTVHAVYKRMPEPLAEILVAHYVVLTPRNCTTRAELMGLSRRGYFERVGRAKAQVEGALAIVETVRTEWRISGGKSPTREISPA